jgi:protein-disulfide isomerase
MKAYRSGLSRASAASLLLVFALLGGACEDSSTGDGRAAGDAGVSLVDPVVGIAAGNAIRMSEIEAPIAPQLFDLDMQRHRELRRSLEIVALRKLESVTDTIRVAELALEPPAPPFVDVAIDPDRVRPGSAPVTILVFCNFESPHCKGAETLMRQVLPLFEGVVRQAARDFVLPFHRNAGLAAQAARCALEQGKYWRFHDRLHAGSGGLGQERIDAAARAVLLEYDRFAECLESGRNAPAVAADNEMALALGFDQVPVLFVNGLYAGNSVDAAQLVGLIESELKRLQVESPRQMGEAMGTSAPLLLTALLHSPWPGEGLAILAPSVAPDRAGVFREGDIIGNDITVRRITPTGVELLNGGVPEWLGFGDGHLASQASDAASEDARAIMRPHRAVPITLDRDEVLVRLSDRQGLREVLVTVPMMSGDYHQLRISEIRPGSLYELLGLEVGDVILGVNEQPVHEAENPLWDALEREDEVRVRVMRRGGLAHHYTYRFDE